MKIPKNAVLLGMVVRPGLDLCDDLTWCDFVVEWRTERILYLVRFGFN